MAMRHMPQQLFAFRRKMTFRSFFLLLIFFLLFTSNEQKETENVKLYENLCSHSKSQISMSTKQTNNRISNWCWKLFCRKKTINCRHRIKSEEEEKFLTENKRETNILNWIVYKYYNVDGKATTKIHIRNENCAQVNE